MKRRNFFKAIARAAAIIALAPEIAFRAKLELPKVAVTLPVFYDIQTPIMYAYLHQRASSYCYDQAYIDKFTEWYGEPPYPLNKSKNNLNKMWD